MQCGQLGGFGLQKANGDVMPQAWSRDGSEMPAWPGLTVFEQHIEAEHRRFLI